MIETKFYCDKCGKEVNEAELHEVIVKNETLTDVISAYKTHMCDECWAKFSTLIGKFNSHKWIQIE